MKIGAISTDRWRGCIVTKDEKRSYKIDTAKVASVRLVAAKPDAGAKRSLPAENAREIVLKLIEAIKRL